MYEDDTEPGISPKWLPVGQRRSAEPACRGRECPTHSRVGNPHRRCDKCIYLTMQHKKYEYCSGLAYLAVEDYSSSSGHGGRGSQASES